MKKVKVGGYFEGPITIKNYTLPDVDGTLGYVLKTDGLGAVTWQADTSGSFTLAGLTDTVGVVYGAGSLLIGDGVDSFDEHVITGDITFDSAGVTTISAGAVDLSMLANISDMTVLGNVSGGAATPAEVTIDTDISTVPGDDSELASSDAIKTYVDTVITGVIGKYTDDFLIADWAGVGPYTLTYTAVTHGLTTDKYLAVTVAEDGTPNEIVGAKVEVADNGDVTITSNVTFDGHIVIFG